ncbi:hypothetical protein L6R53_26695 [Myxococcota bacterium]|nr:hypothetical protein [Myxococcota bacterium]
MRLGAPPAPSRRTPRRRGTWEGGAALGALALAWGALGALAWGALGAPARASTCEEVAAVPDALQVAWVAPLGRRVGADASLEVVRVSDLRARAREVGGADRVLQVLGLLGRKPTEGQRERAWQVVVFDVRAEWLCRPVEEVEEGALLGGVPTCTGDEVGPARGHRKGWTGCGYSLDTGASTRGLDVFRVDWETASTNGFCLMPLQRFLDGA